MNVLPMHPEFKMPTRSTDLAGGYDIYMPEGGTVMRGARRGLVVPLGFSTEIPESHVALLLPRSGVGSRHGIALNNTCGIIDADYRGEWKASLILHASTSFFTWEPGDRILQFLIVPVVTPPLVEASKPLEATDRTGGFGSTGQ